MPHYDAIVIGTGGVGSAALYQLAKRGVRALGIDQFPVPNAQGSSHGHTRIFRQAYFEHADYVPLARHSLRLWQSLSDETGQALFHKTGLVEFGPEQGVVVPGVLAAAEKHGLEVESLTVEAARARWPMLQAPNHFLAVYEPDAGYLLVEDCVATQMAQAREHGAVLRFGERVAGWSAEPGGFVVTTDAGRYSSELLVVTAGAWAGALLSDLGIPLEVLRKSMFWLGGNAADFQQGLGMPLFFFETGEGMFYGFPQIDGRGVKIAEHTGGEAVKDPLAVDRSQWPRDEQRIRSFASRHLPGLGQRISRHAVCMYTMSPDQHFILDRHPGYPGLVFAAGLSGHGFKFTPSLGLALADLALDGATQLPVGFLSLARFA